MIKAGEDIPKRLRNCCSIKQLQEIARKKLPLPVREFIDGGADDELTLAENSRVFSDYTLMPSYGDGLEVSDLSSKVLGMETAWPVLISPWGAHKMAHSDGETATAKAAQVTGTIYCMSNFSTVSMEEVARNSDCLRVFQMMPARDDEIMKQMMTRAKASGYQALIITIDNPITGNRERDVKTGMGFPPQLTLGSYRSVLSRPRWLANYIKAPPDFANFRQYFESGKDQDWILHNLIGPTTWETLSWIRRQWDGPLAIKGIMSADNAKKAVSIGVDGVIVSNQGARYFDATPASFAALPEVLDAVNDKAEVILDGGIRRGTDILKALAMGANACMTARPFAYGLAAAGSAGVEFAINLLKQELSRAMIVSNLANIDAIHNQILRKL